MLEINFTEYVIIGLRNGLIIGGTATLVAEGINLALKLFKS